MRDFDLKTIRSKTKNHSPLDKKLLENFDYKVLEIGAGTGMHPLSYAQKFPDRFIIAVEKTNERFGKFFRAYQKLNLKNILPVQSHAVSWAVHNLEGLIFDEIFILYPNPNPKISDLNKRWHAMPFFGFLKSILKHRGKITIRTNELFYADEAEEFMSNIWGLQVEKKAFSLNNVKDFKTLFEKKYLERGQTCFEITGLKID